MESYEHREARDYFSRMVLLVPSNRGVLEQTRRFMSAIQQRMCIDRYFTVGASHVGICRSSLLSAALVEFPDATGFLWLDDDVYGDDDGLAILRMMTAIWATRAENAVIGGIYPKRSMPMTTHEYPEASACWLASMGSPRRWDCNGALWPVAGMGFGFVYTSRVAVDGVGANLEDVTYRYKNAPLPGKAYFKDVIIAGEKGSQLYCGEDVGFCIRAMQAGYPVYAHTGVLLNHQEMSWRYIAEFVRSESEKMISVGVALPPEKKTLEPSFLESVHEPMVRREDVYVWVHACPQRSPEEAKEALFDSGLAKGEVCVHEDGLDAYQIVEWWRHQWDRMRNRPERWILRVEDDVVVHEQLWEHLAKWGAPGERDFIAGLLMLRDDQLRQKTLHLTYQGNLALPPAIWKDGKVVEGEHWEGGQMQLIETSAIDAVMARVPKFEKVPMGEFDVGMQVAAHELGGRLYGHVPALGRSATTARESAFQKVDVRRAENVVPMRSEEFLAYAWTALDWGPSRSNSLNYYDILREMKATSNSME